MRATDLISLAAAAAIMASVSITAEAAQRDGKPLNPATLSPADPLASNPHKDSWRDRALRARAEAPETTGSVTGRGTRMIDERGDRTDGEDAGNGRLRGDTGAGKSRLD